MRVALRTGRSNGVSRVGGVRGGVKEAGLGEVEQVSEVFVLTLQLSDVLHCLL